MGNHPGVSVAIAILVNDELWGAVTPVMDNANAVKATVAEIQPKYAVPSRIFSFASLPLTP